MTYWFRFKRPEAKLYVYLTPFKTTPTIHGRVEEGRAGGIQNDMRFMSADKTFLFSPGVPAAQTPRPEYLLLPDLADALRYAATRREDVATDFFRFSGCLKAGD